MFDWLFGKTQNTHSREVKVISSRYPTKTFTVYGDLPVDEFRAFDEVAAQLPPPEPGETRYLKTHLGNR